MPGFTAKSTQLYPHGQIDELLSVPVAALVHMDYENDGRGQNVRVLAVGDFVVSLVLQSASQIMATLCSVDGFQWPLAKDSVVIRMGWRTFAVAMPGLLYGIQFPSVVPEAVVHNLTAIFMKFGHYKDTIDNREGYPMEDNTPNIWNMMRPQIEPMAHELLTQLGQLSGLSGFCVSDTNSCHLRAVRMSNATKMIADSMVRTGTLSEAAGQLATIARRGGPTEEQRELGVTYASVNAFTCLVDAIEFLWVLTHSLPGLVEGVELRSRGSRNIGYAVWGLNAAGLAELLLSTLDPTAGEASSSNVEP